MVADRVEGMLVVLGSVLSMMIGFVLGLLVRNSPGAIVGYFVISFVMPGLTELLASTQEWFGDARGWVDLNYAQGALFQFDGGLAAREWEYLAVTHVAWLVVPLLIALWFVRRSEVK